MIDPYSPPTTQSVDATDELDRFRRPIFWWGLSSILALSLAAIFISLAAATFGEIFLSFGARLPLPTRAVLNGYPLLWVLPASAAAMITDAMRRDAITAEYRSRMIRIFVALIILAVVLVVAAIVVLYLPLYELKRHL